MKNLNNLSKTSELIGKFTFYTIVTVLSIAGVVMSLTRLEDKPEIISIILILAGTLIAILIFFFVIRTLFRPIYNLNKYVHLKRNNQITEKEFKNKWLLSLICSLIFGLLFIVGTFGISLILMIPHYILLIKTSVRNPQGMPNTQSNLNSDNSSNSGKSIFNHTYDLKKITEIEMVIISLGIGLITSILSGSIFCKTKYYRLYKGNTMEVSKEISTFELSEFNYLLAVSCFVMIAGISYFYLNGKRKK